MTIHSGMNLLDAVRLARQLGVRVERVRRTGEFRFTYPGLPYVTANGRWKDAPRQVTSLLLNVAALQQRP